MSNSSNSSGSSNSSEHGTPTAASATTATTSLVVGGATFTEMSIMEQIYGELLTKAGYAVTYRTAASREIYATTLESGQISVVPEYTATFAEYLNMEANGPNAKAIATSDPDATVTTAQRLAKAKGLTFLTPSKASDQNGFAVSKAFAVANKITTLSQLAALNRPVTFAAPAECVSRPFCGQGLVTTYGLKIAKYIPLDFDSPQAKQAAVNGTATMALVGTTDGTLDQLGLVLLQDDKKLQLADNLVPVVNTAKAGGPKIAAALNQLAGVLTTADLAALNLQVDGQRMKPADVAKAYLRSKGLL